MHSRSTAPGNVDRTANLLGALALEVTRAQEQATHAVVGQAGLGQKDCGHAHVHELVDDDVVADQNRCLDEAPV